MVDRHRQFNLQFSASRDKFRQAENCSNPDQFASSVLDNTGDADFDGLFLLVGVWDAGVFAGFLEDMVCGACHYFVALCIASASEISEVGFVFC